MKTTRIEWHPAGAPYLATCCEGFERRCGEHATWSRQWQTESMSAPAFDYYCDTHATLRAEADGLSLEAEAEADPPEWNRPLSERIADVSAERNPYAVGSIWNTSWGYDQTNVEFLQVVRESKASVWLAPMGSEIRDGRQYPTVATGLADAVSMHRKGKHGAYVRLDYVRSAWPYAGGGCYSTAASGQAGH